MLNKNAKKSSEFRDVPSCVVVDIFIHSENKSNGNQLDFIRLMTKLLLKRSVPYLFVSTQQCLFILPRSSVRCYVITNNELLLKSDTRRYDFFALCCDALKPFYLLDACTGSVKSDSVTTAVKFVCVYDIRCADKHIRSMVTGNARSHRLNRVAILCSLSVTALQ